jgi:hypothetical protein
MDSCRIFVFDAGGDPNTGFVRRSNDGGLTWSAPFPEYYLASIFSDSYANASCHFLLGYSDDIWQRFDLYIYNARLDSYKQISDGYGFGALYDNGDDLVVPFSQRLRRHTTDSLFGFVTMVGSPNEVKIVKLLTTDARHAWLVGEPGRIFRKYGSITSVNEERSKSEVVTGSLCLHNYPNPFNPTTTVLFDLPEPCHVALAVYDYLGREVTRLASGPHAAGRHEISFDASNLRSGVYFYRLTADNSVEVRKMVLLK